MQWFDRKFKALDTGLSFHGIMERLSDTPLRIRHKVAGIDALHWTVRSDDKWSIQEHIGHLLDLEPIWHGRVLDFIEGQPELRAADLSNRKTHMAEHNSSSMEALLDAFSTERQSLVRAFLSMTPQQLNDTALHPRLKSPMLPTDLAYFIAEHDDHHLAAISRLAA